MTATILRITTIAASLLALTGCGLKPIYATTETKAGPLSQRIAIAEVTGPYDLQQAVRKALESYIVPKEGEAAKYALHVNAEEAAQALAVQIDASVTRLNYRISANYALIEIGTGRSINGTANSVTSFNITTSQYSTLFAERAAQEKAARILAEEIERDVLIRLAADDSPFKAPATKPASAGSVGGAVKVDEDGKGLEIIDGNPEAETDAGAGDGVVRIN